MGRWNWGSLRRNGIKLAHMGAGGEDAWTALLAYEVGSADPPYVQPAKTERSRWLRCFRIARASASEVVADDVGLADEVAGIGR